MNPQGGQGTNEAQRRTAAEIARKKVLAAYSHLQENQSQGTQANPKAPQSSAAQPLRLQGTSKSAGSVFYQTDRPPQTKINVQETGNYKSMPVNQSAISSADWAKYHSAWQNYYQKYYSDYYSKAAKQYIETEKLREARELSDLGEAASASADGGKTAGLKIANAEEPQETDSLALSLKETIQKKASESRHKKRRFRKFMPLIAGAVVTLTILFLQYNRMIFAPLAAYVSPGSDIDTSITAIDPTITANVGNEERLIIPKLNIDVPIIFGAGTGTAETMEAMNHGVAHWPIPGASAYPGQIGNMVITGHSAGDIYSSNQYKFIFSGLERLTENDLIYVDYGGVRYTYVVRRFETVEPTEVSKLVYDTDKPMLTLITCTPLGTSRYRLLVTAEQISPAASGESQDDSGAGTTAELPSADGGEVEMAGNSPTFFESIWNWLTGR